MSTKWADVNENWIFMGYTDGAEELEIKLKNSTQMPYMDSNIGKKGERLQIERITLKAECYFTFHLLAMKHIIM